MIAAAAIRWWKVPLPTPNRRLSRPGRLVTIESRLVLEMPADG